MISVGFIVEGLIEYFPLKSPDTNIPLKEASSEIY